MGGLPETRPAAAPWPRNSSQFKQQQVGALIAGLKGNRPAGDKTKAITLAQDTNDRAHQGCCLGVTLGVSIGLSLEAVTWGHGNCRCLIRRRLSWGNITGNYFARNHLNPALGFRCHRTTKLLASASTGPPEPHGPVDGHGPLLALRIDQ
jgi:hypothetical protein